MNKGNTNGASHLTLVECMKPDFQSTSKTGQAFPTPEQQHKPDLKHIRQQQEMGSDL